MEYMVAAKAAARALQVKPVKWVASRAARTWSRWCTAVTYVIDIAKLGVTKDGKITGLQGDVTAVRRCLPGHRRHPPDADADDVGRRLRHRRRSSSTGPHGAHEQHDRSARIAVPDVRRPRSCIERVIDVAAAKIGMDPAEIRRKQLLRPVLEVPDSRPTPVRQLRLGRVRASRSTRCSPRPTTSRAARRAEAPLDVPPATRRCRWASACRRTSRSPLPVGLHIEWGKRARSTTTARRHDLRRHVGPWPGSRAPRSAMLASRRCSASRWTRSTFVNSDTDQCAAWLGHARLALAADRRLGDPPRVEGSARPRAEKIAAHLLEANARGHRQGRARVRLHVAGVALQGRSRGRELAVASKDASQADPTASSPASFTHELDFDGTNSTFPFGAHVAVVDVDS